MLVSQPVWQRPLSRLTSPFPSHGTHSESGSGEGPPALSRRHRQPKVGDAKEFASIAALAVINVVTWGRDTTKVRTKVRGEPRKTMWEQRWRRETKVRQGRREGSHDRCVWKKWTDTMRVWKRIRTDKVRRKVNIHHESLKNMWERRINSNRLS